jgi:hypothetical protein
MQGVSLSSSIEISIIVTYSVAPSQAYPTRPREQWVLEWPGQVVIAVGQVYWTQSVIDAIENSSLDELAKQNTEDLQQEVSKAAGMFHLSRIYSTKVKNGQSCVLYFNFFKCFEN